MAKVKQGDAVVIAQREQTPQDVKSGLYYPHYSGLRGTVLKVYGEEAAVQVDRDTLPKEVKARHDEGEKAMRQKWLDGLSEEARGRTGERERAFSLNYAVLVSVGDLQPDRGAAKRAAQSAPAAPAPTPAQAQEAKAVGQAAKAVDPSSGESDVASAARNADGASESGTDSAVRRAKLTDLEQAEEAFLQQRRAAAAQNGQNKTPKAR